MLVLGIDTSCDDTSAALLSLDNSFPKVLTNAVSNQSSVHSKYGGIVPEIASRSHMEMIWPVVEEALEGRDISSLNAIAVCHGPGLIGSLLVGCSFAKALCYAKNIPLVAVNHLEGHLLSAFLDVEPPEFPFLSLVVSGGHTSIYLAKGFCEYETLGSTRDDAAGEAYDKVAKLLGLGYPGGPVIDSLAREGKPLNLPRPYLPETLDFSFSGLKTAVRLAAQSEPNPATEDIAAGFQASVVDVLVRKIQWAIEKTGVKHVTVAGGVAANRELRDRMNVMCGQYSVRLHLPELKYCTDNAAMIAYAGALRFMRGEHAGLDLNPLACLPL